MLPYSKTTVATQPVALTNGATNVVNAPIDTKGAKFVRTTFLLSAADVVSNAPSVLKMQESDDTNATNAVDIVGLRGGTDFTIGNAYTNTAGQNVWRLDVNVLGSRKRYLFPVISPRTTQTALIIAEAFRLEQSPATPAAAGLLAGVVL